MLRIVVTDSDTLPSDVGGGPAIGTLNPNRRHRQSKQQTRLHKRQRKTAGKEKGNGPLPEHGYSKWLEMRRKDRDDIERNRIQIRTIANLVHSILQVPKSSSSADSVAAPQTPPALGDIYDPFVTSKPTVRHAFSDIKDEEGENDDGGEATYGDLARSYVKSFFHHVDTSLKIITVSEDTGTIL